VEEAEALDRLVTEQNYTQEQLGAIIGKARTTVTRPLKNPPALSFPRKRESMKPLKGLDSFSFTRIGTLLNDH
jgi:ParB-like chromosome segregation protein Spo0J